MHDYKTIASIVGEDKIQALRDAGVDIGDKPTQPTSNLLGRWAKHPECGDVLITSDKAYGECIDVSVYDSDWLTGSFHKRVQRGELTFPEQTTCPEDVPVGGAWLINVDDLGSIIKQAVAIKISENCWVVKLEEMPHIRAFGDRHVTLITPLVPANPQDQGQPSDITPPEQTTCPEDVTVGEQRFVTTQEEHEALLVGSIVARDGGDPYVKIARSKWKSLNNSTRTNVEMGGVRQVRRVLRRGWAKSHTAHHAEGAQSNGNV